MLELVAILSPIFVTLFWALFFIFSYRKEDKPKQIMLVFMISAFLLYVSHAIFFNGKHLLYFQVEPLYLLTNLSVYPLYYLYVRFITVDERFAVRHLYLFLPALFISLASLISGLMINPDARGFYVEEFLYNRNFDSFRISSASWFKMMIFLVGRVLFIILVFYSLLKGIILIQQHEERILNSFSNKTGKSLSLVKVITITFLLTSCMSTVLAIIGRNQFIDSKQFLLIPSVIFSTMIFLIGFQGSKIKPIPVKCNPENSYLPEEDSGQELKKKLLSLFNENQIFKNPELKICDISQEIKADSSNITRLINDEFKVNFCDFVNLYRISTAKSMILNDSAKKLTLEGIAREAGFHSLESFIRVFKEYEGMSPVKFKEVMDSLKGRG